MVEQQRNHRVEAADDSERQKLFIQKLFLNLIPHNLLPADYYTLPDGIRITGNDFYEARHESDSPLLLCPA